MICSCGVFKLRYSFVALICAGLWVVCRLGLGAILAPDIFTEMYRISVGCIFVGSALAGIDIFVKPKAFRSAEISVRSFHWIIAAILLAIYLMQATAVDHLFDYLGLAFITYAIVICERINHISNIRDDFFIFVRNEVSLVILRISVFCYILNPIYCLIAALLIIFLIRNFKWGFNGSTDNESRCVTESPNFLDSLSWLLVLALGWLLPVILESFLPTSISADMFFKAFIIMNAITNVANLILVRRGFSEHKGRPVWALGFASFLSILVYIIPIIIVYGSNELGMFSIDLFNKIGIFSVPVVLIFYMASRILRNSVVLLDRFNLGETPFFAFFNCIQFCILLFILLLSLVVKIDIFSSVLHFLILSNFLIFLFYNIWYRKKIYR